MSGIKNRFVIPFEEGHRNINEVFEKLCNKCLNWFPATTEYFYRNKSAPDGLFPYCKKCNIKKREEEYSKNKEKVNLRNKVWRDNNKETMHNLKKNWRDRNKEHMYEYGKNYRQNNSEKFNEYSKERQNRNHKITKKEWENCKEYFNHKCAYCDMSLDEHKKIIGTDFHKEHVIHNGENDLSNCVPSCKICNSSKWEFTLEGWYSSNNPVFNQERYNKIIKWTNEDYRQYINNNK